MRKILALVLFLLAAPALAKSGRDAFVPAHDADVLDQPTSKTKVGHIQVGQSYTLLKKGGPGGAWCKLDLGGKAGWIPCSEGSGGDANAASPAPAKSQPEVAKETLDAPTGHGASCSTRCDHAPLFSASPALSALDREVLSLCPDNPAASVGEGDVRRFFAAHVSDPRIQTALSQAGRSGSREANLDWLTHLWVSSGPRNAFTHVFCGDDWGRDAIGGLHFLPRYAALEHDGKICFDGAVKGQPVVAGQYLIRFHGVAPWSCAVKRIGGFPVEHDAVNVVATAIRAYVRCCERDGQRRQGGVFSAPDLGAQRWQIWCNERNGTYGIASFYPTDAKPSCGD